MTISDEIAENMKGTAPQRGTTTIPARVVARIAEQAASEVRFVGSAAGGVMGVGARRDFSSRPTVECDLYGNMAVLRMDIGMVFPLPLHSSVQELRERMRTRVENLTGLEVGRIDIEISWLDPSSTIRGALR
ncbi:Asp23 family [Corynebacterium mustelae]|uniref:Asp23 family n=1 Tax=Corynebacterium mustelae TaxID=571915 RepID=A0A0G3H7R8_9CORY|nr:Asp23 family [Corynebacterium mustelae]